MMCMITRVLEWYLHTFDGRRVGMVCMVCKVWLEGWMDGWPTSLG